VAKAGPRAETRRLVIRHKEQITALLQAEGDRLYRLLWRLTLREDVAEDLLQDLAVKLAQSDGFAQAERPATYARSAAMNLAFDWRRRKGNPASLAGDVSQPAADATPLQELIEGEQIEAMLTALSDLADRDRWVLTLRYLEGLSHGEISRELDCPTHQARAWCHRALHRLRQQMSESNDSDVGAEEVSR
jgi:RNA polymerase sigma factor (sigma-70 family)